MKNKKGGALIIFVVLAMFVVVSFIIVVNLPKESKGIIGTGQVILETEEEKSLDNSFDNYDNAVEENTVTEIVLIVKSS